MTSDEFDKLKKDDIVTLGSRVGKVISKSPHTVTVHWDDGRAVQYDFKQIQEIEVR